MAAIAINADALQSAFENFKQQSGLLAHSYRDQQAVTDSLVRRLRLAQAKRFVELERLGAIGEMTAGFAHQVRTPLASAKLCVAQLDLVTPQQQRVAQKITERLNEVERMVNDMLGFAAGIRRAEESVSVHELLSEAVSSIEAQLGDETEVRITLADTSLSVNANKDALKGAILNLISNAEQACVSPAVIALGGECVNGYVHLTVSDNGHGIPQDVLPRLFEPFFTTRPQGTGLGLAVVRAVANTHNGDVSVTSTDMGTTFTIRLPGASANAEESANG